MLTFLRPKMSDQRPKTGVNARELMRYALATHELSLPPCKLEVMLGKAVATLTHTISYRELN
jgi:hypothetical protein